MEEDGTKLYYRYPCNFTANWFQGKHKKQYTHVLDDFNPDTIFTLGSVTNKSIIYWSMARKRGIKSSPKSSCKISSAIIIMLIMRGAFALSALTFGFKEASLFRNCVRSNDKGLKGFIKKLNSTINRYRLQRELTKADAVITSSQQQVGFYVRYGIHRDHCYTTPLYFNGDKLKKYNPTMGDYFVFVAQNRIDKGIHLLKDVLEHCNSNVKVVAAYASQKEY